MPRLNGSKGSNGSHWHFWQWGLLWLVCTVLLSACSLTGGGSSGSQAKPTPTPTPTPTPSPTPTIPALPLVTYQGDGYSIGYPAGWKVDAGQPGLVTFSDPQGITYLAVHFQSNPDGLVSAKEQVAAGLQLFRTQVTHYQQVNIAATTTVAGETWSQGAATGDLTIKGQPAPVPVKIVVLAANHPPSSPQTRSFTIAYATAQALFDLANQEEFQPMLQSFRFTS